MIRISDLWFLYAAQKFAQMANFALYKFASANLRKLRLSKESDYIFRIKMDRFRASAKQNMHIAQHCWRVCDVANVLPMSWFANALWKYLRCIFDVTSAFATSKTHMRYRKCIYDIANACATLQMHLRCRKNFALLVNDYNWKKDE